ncbi:hypothetical protein PIB30_097237, partial [Stylosanthes scabra]|nr:hypothetical protein [Stylosanthes scabra]
EADSQRSGKSCIATCSGSPTEGSCICWCDCLTMSTSTSPLDSTVPQHVMDFLVDVGHIPAGQPVAATPIRIAEPPAPETEAAMGHSEEDDSDYTTSTASSSDAQEGGEGGAETRSASCPRYILAASPPIPRVEDVPCFF